VSVQKTLLISCHNKLGAGRGSTLTVHRHR